jgi:hypothetical protein
MICMGLTVMHELKFQLDCFEVVQAEVAKREEEREREGEREREREREEGR